MNAYELLRNGIDDAYPAWSASSRVFWTRAGGRYSAIEPARLVAPPLARLGLRVHFDPDRGDGGEELFVTATRHVPRRTLVEILDRALDGHPDETLRPSATSAHTLRELLSLLPSAEAAPTVVERVPASRSAYIPVAVREHVEAFITKDLRDGERTREAFLRYQEDADAEGLDAVGAKKRGGRDRVGRRRPRPRRSARPPRRRRAHLRDRAGGTSHVLHHR